MRNILLCLIAILLPLHAEEWRSDIYNCTLNLPSSAGWQQIPPQDVPGVATLVAMQNPTRQAVFGLSVLTEMPSADLRNPNTSTRIEVMLHKFGYTFIGHSTVNIAGREWMQYPVQATNAGQTVSGIIRYTSDHGNIYGLSLLLGGGKPVVQDAELQAAAASFRLFAPLTVVTAAPAPSSPAGQKPSTPTKADAPETAAAAAAQPDYIRYAILGGIALLVLLIFAKVIGGSKK